MNSAQPNGRRALVTGSWTGYQGALTDASSMTGLPVPIPPGTGRRHPARVGEITRPCAVADCTGPDRA
ncbi:hypothetical protein NS14008_26865 [Nocardia seriolae]|nr:hypothetical protein NS14008_26865 [Nocardia seriolae]PSK32149.1 hypothetical protein C6575_06875 [Nocardia seriolae]RLP32526.1 hypothetical protein D6158_07630 [Nocardia seriolae]